MALNLNRPLARRDFLQGLASTLIAAPFVTTGLRAASPNGKLRHAAFGASGMAWEDITALAKHPQWELAAVCDVDTRNFERVKAQFPEVKCYQDWRELLAKEGDRIDSVNVSTPDHMHAPIGLRAIELGKHIYGQKPLAQTLHECRQLMLKARDRGVMTQMGIQVSSDATERSTVELIRSGAIGKVKEVHTFSHKKWGDTNPLPDRADPIPAGFDWNLWLGPAADRPYLSEYYHPKHWRRRRDFGTGTLGDMGCHMFSGWFRALDLAAPISVKSMGAAPVNSDNWANDAIVEYTFKGTAHTASAQLTVMWYDGDARPSAEVQALVPEGQFPKQGSVYVGTEGVLVHSHFRAPVLHPSEKFASRAMPDIEPRNHWFEFIDCCRNGGAKPSANFDYAAPLTEAVLLGCLATAFPKQELPWDAPALRIANHEAANALVKRQYRPGWEI